MSTAFALSANFLNQLFSVDTTTGAFTGGPIIGPIPDGFRTILLVYNCTTSTMYIVLAQGGGPAIFKTGILDTSTGIITNMQDVPSNIDSLYSLAWNSALGQMFAYGGTNTPGGGPTMLTVDIDANTWVPLGSVTQFGESGILYDCDQDKLIGISGSDTFGGVTPNSVFEISPGDGSWTFITAMSQSNFGFPIPSYDQAANSACFLSTTNNNSNPPQLFYVDTTSGIVTAPLPGDTLIIPTGFAFQQPCCCLHEDTMLALQSGSIVRIADLKSGDVVLDNFGYPVRIENNARVGMSKQFVSLPKGCLGNNEPNSDLLIRKGHPLLFQGREVNCEVLVGQVPRVEEIVLSERKAIYTLITDRKRFVRMNGCSVATWSRSAFDQFVNNDPVGRSVFYQLN